MTMWTHYELLAELTDVAGGLPVDPRLIEAWQQANWRKSAKLLPEDPQSPQEAAERTAALVPVGDETGWTTFPRMAAEGRVVLGLEGRQIKAAIKEAANILRPLLGKNERGKDIQWRARIAERVFVMQRLIPLYPLREEPDETLERPIHVMTAQGPRDAIKRTDVCRDVSFSCTLRVLADGLVTPKIVGELAEYMAQNGIGADRSQGFGTGTITVK